MDLVWTVQFLLQTSNEILKEYLLVPRSISIYIFYIHISNILIFEEANLDLKIWNENKSIILLVTLN